MFTRLSCFGACLGSLFSIFAWAEAPEFPVFFTEKAQIAVDGKAQVRVVKLGHAEGDTVQILSGLNAGDVVVIDGADWLREGAALRIVSGGQANAGQASGDSAK